MNTHGYQNVQEFLVGLILLLAVGLVLLLFYRGLGEKATERQDMDLCREQIEINAIGRVGGMEIFDIGKCPVEYVSVKDDEEKDMKAVLAKEMATCWYKLGEGQYELFDLHTKKIQYCVICSVLMFENHQQKIDGMLAYLGKEQAPLLYTKGETMSYADYMHNYRSDKSIQLLYDEETTDIIDTAYDYTTIFLYAKKGHVSKVWSTFGGLALGTVGGALVLSGIGAPVGIGLLAGSAAAGIGGAALGYNLGSDTSATWESGILLYPYDTAALKRLDCEVLPAQQ